MSKWRRAAKIDNNQADIVDALGKIPGITVAKGHDDIFIGYRGRNYWFEIKNPDQANKKGEIFPSAFKPSQKKLLETWAGHYQAVTTLDEILTILGITP